MLLRLPHVKTVLFLYCLLLLLSLSIDVVLGDDYSATYQSVLMLFEILPCALFFSIHFMRQGNDSEPFLKAMVILGVVQSLIVVVLYLLPSYNYELKHSFLRFEEDDVIMLLAHRGFGLTCFYTYAMPIFIGFVCAIVIHLSITRKTIYLLALPLLLFTIAVNARIGFVPVVVYLCLSPILLAVKGKRVSFVIVSGAVAAMIIFIAQIDVEAYSQYNFYPTMKWLEEGFQEISGGKTETTLKTLEGMVHFPPAWNWVVGTGIHIFSNPKVSIHSDIGYILQFYYGGVAYLLLLVSPLLLMLIAGIRRAQDYSVRVLLTSFVLSIIIANYKGDFFTNNEAFKGMTICAFVMMGFKDMAGGRNRVDLKSPQSANGGKIEHAGVG